MRVIVPLALVLACQPGELAKEVGGGARAPGDVARELAIDVDRLRPSLTATSWQSTIGDAAASLTGYAEGDTLRLVREVLDQGDNGRSAARYYFAGGRLRYYEREGEVAAEGTTSSPTLAREKVVLAFDEQGGTAELSRTVDGATAPLDGARIEGVVARAAELMRQWGVARAGAGGQR